MQSLAPPFALDRIDIYYVNLSLGLNPALLKEPPFKLAVPQHALYFAFVVKGSGKLLVDEAREDLKEWDCFGFSPSAEPFEYGIKPTDGSSVSLFLVSDKPGIRESINASDHLMCCIHDLSNNPVEIRTLFSNHNPCSGQS